MSFAAGTNWRSWEAAGDENQTPQKPPWSLCLHHFCPAVKNESKRWIISIFSWFHLAMGSCTHLQLFRGTENCALTVRYFVGHSDIFSVSPVSALPALEELRNLNCWGRSWNQPQQHLWSLGFERFQGISHRIFWAAFLRCTRWKSRSVWRAERETENTFSSHRKHFFFL